MKNILKLEELAMLGICIYALIRFNVAWWWYPILVLGPDISMLGYVGGNKTGAFVYNLFHHKAIAVIVFVIGIIDWNPTMQVIGIVLFGHSSMDRLFDYGLKTEEGFKYTHLGIIGKH